MHQQKILKYFCLFGSAIASLLGVFVLVGWYTKSLALIQVLPIFVPMQYNTALGFLICGAGLLLALFGKKFPSKVIAIIIGLIGALTIVEYAFDINIGIDELFMKHDIVVKTSHPGRMAPNTALCFLLSSIAIFYVNTRNNQSLRVIGVLGSFIFGLGIVAFTGYMVGLENTYGWGKLTRMAIHTSVGFMLIGLVITALSWIKETHRIRPYFLGYAAAFTLTILFIDMTLPKGYAIGILYVVLVLMSWFIPHKKATLIFAGMATIICIIGFYLSPDGQEFWVEVSNRSLSVLSIWIVAGLLFSVKEKSSELENANAILKERSVQLEKRNQELEQFVYIASHDLQEPLRTVLSYSEILEEDYSDKLDEEGRQFTKFIAQVAHRMSALIKSLLDYSRISRDQLTQEVNVNHIVANVQEDMGVLIANTKTQIFAQNLPEKLNGDTTKIRMLFQNLIGNSIKFQHPDRHPVIKINAEETEHYWKFSIADNGIGIAPQYQNKIFEIFQRLHLRSDYEGTGIGLAHCRKIVDMHQGEIWLDAETEVGATFHFTLKKI